MSEEPQFFSPTLHPLSADCDGPRMTCSCPPMVLGSVSEQKQCAMSCSDLRVRGRENHGLKRLRAQPETANPHDSRPLELVVVF